MHQSVRKCNNRLGKLGLVFKKGRAITGAYYAALSDRLVNEIRKKRPHLKKKKILFHDDNANHSELIRKKFCISFDEKWSKINPNQSDQFRDINPNESVPIRNQVFNPDKSESFRPWIHSD